MDILSKYGLTYRIYKPNRLSIKHSINYAHSHDLNLPRHRYRLIELFLDELFYVYLEDTERYFTVPWSLRDFNEAIQNILQTSLFSFKFSNSDHSEDAKLVFHHATDDLIFLLEEEIDDKETVDNIIDFLSPGWKLRKKFLSDDFIEVRKEIEQSISDSIASKVDFDSFRKDLYQELPKMLLRCKI